MELYRARQRKREFTVSYRCSRFAISRNRWTRGTRRRHRLQRNSQVNRFSSVFYTALLIAVSIVRTIPNSIHFRVSESLPDHSGGLRRRSLIFVSDQLLCANWLRTVTSGQYRVQIIRRCLFTSLDRNHWEVINLLFILPGLNVLKTEKISQFLKNPLDVKVISSSINVACFFIERNLIEARKFVLSNHEKRERNFDFLYLEKNSINK